MKNLVICFIVSVALFACTVNRKSVPASSGYLNTPADLSSVIYEGGDGTTIENAIVIKNAGNERNGVASEYAYISKKYGQRFRDWRPAEQSVTTDKGKKYDIIHIETIPYNLKLIFYFDITDFYGKF